MSQRSKPIIIVLIIVVIAAGAFYYFVLRHGREGIFSMIMRHKAMMRMMSGSMELNPMENLPESNMFKEAELNPFSEAYENPFK